MADSLLKIIGFALVTSFAGFNIVTAYDRKGSLGEFETAALSYLFGIGAISIEMFIFSLFGLKFTTAHILMPWVLLAIINIPRFKRRLLKAGVGKENFRKLNLPEAIIAILLISVIAYAFLMALVRPVESYDAVAIWSLKAKMFYMAHTIPGDFFTMSATKFGGIHPDYPLLLPLSQTWFYTFINGFNDHLVKVLFPLNFLAFLAFFYVMLKKVTANRLFALIFTFLLASVRQFSNYATNGYADMQIAIYATLAFLSLYMWIRNTSAPYLWTAFFSCIFAMWTKNEGAVVFLGFVAIVVVDALTRVKEKGKSALVSRKGAIFAVITLCALFALWSFFKTGMHVRNDVVNTGTFAAYDFSSIFKRIFAILYEYQRQIFGVKYWNLSWIVFILLAAVGYKKIFSDNTRYMTIPIFLTLLCYTFIYLITPQDIEWHLRKSASRLLIHILPLVIFYVGVRTKEICSNE